MTSYAKKELARYWPVAAELMAQYRDGSQTYNDIASISWRQNNQLHRDGDLPAFIGRYGTLEWRQNNQLHRDGDLPAVIGKDGQLEWWKNSLRHRSCGPAVIYASSRLEWWINNREITQEVRKWLVNEEWQGTTEQIVEFQLRFI